MFIDTDVFLSFYHLSSDHLEEPKKFPFLLKQKRVNLVLPQHVEMEFRRNRENKIADAINRLRDVRLNLMFPQMCKDYVGYNWHTVGTHPKYERPP